MLQFLKDFKLVNYDLTFNVIAFKVTNITFFTFSVYILFEILYRNSTWAQRIVGYCNKENGK